MTGVRIDKVLDLRNLVCPRPIIMTISTLKSMTQGQVLQVTCDDPTTKHSITGFCERSGFKLLEMKEQDKVISFIIQK